MWCVKGFSILRRGVCSEEGVVRCAEGGVVWCTEEGCGVLRRGVVY